jgi:hypothetical protein
LRKDAVGVACADFQAALLVLEGARQEARRLTSLSVDGVQRAAETRAGRSSIPVTDDLAHTRDVGDEVLSEILRRALRIADEIAVLTAGEYFVGAWARWRTLFELAVSALFIHFGAFQTNPRPTADEARFAHRPPEERRQELARRYMRAESLWADSDRYAFHHFAAKELLDDLSPEQRASSTKRQREARKVLGGEWYYLWAFPHYRARTPPSIDKVLEVLDSIEEFAHWQEASDLPADSPLPKLEEPRGTQFQIFQLRASKALWKLASEAVHRGTITPWDSGLYGASALRESMVPLANVCVFLPSEVLVPIITVFDAIYDAWDRVDDHCDSVLPADRLVH